MSDDIFNYRQAAKRENIPQGVFSQIVAEAKAEFPFDEMLQELHIIRAINSYTIKAKQTAS